MSSFRLRDLDHLSQAEQTDFFKKVYDVTAKNDKGMDPTIEDIETEEDAIKYLKEIKEGPSIPLEAIECKNGPGTKKMLKNTRIPLKIYLDYIDHGKIEKFFEEYDLPSETEELLRKGI